MKAKDHKAIIRVTDHGIGVAQEDRHRILERFERAAPIQKFGGWGIGLFIAREIVRAHHGSIHIESETGKGSTFVVELPLQPSPMVGSTQESR